MNSILRSIELTTRLLAPALLGQLFDFAGYIWTGFFLAAWNVASVVAEYSLLANIYRLDRGRKKKAHAEICCEYDTFPTLRT